ncbi:MAG TPA: outer membrane beta-barrel protein [Flavobacteriales bacterium]|nr:outer membrane beta-barrel protein [Flavobacteriales bacterium]HRJ38086.1 outer membrane beta-barrel protein [Flavobacteriales bacterium]
MKKLTGIVLGLFLGTALMAQDGAGNEQNFRFGLNAMPSINFYKPADIKRFESNGAVMKFAWGLSLDFKLGGTAWLSTGLHVAYDGGKIGFKDTVVSFIKDNEFSTPDAFVQGAGVGFTQTRVEERKYSATYVTLPLNIKMKTKEIGYLNYYGLFGVSAGIKVKSRVDEDGKLFGTNNAASNDAMDNSKDMGFFRAGVNIGGGAEWNLSGTTSLTFGLQYNMGFTNVVKKDSEYLYKYSSTPTPAFTSLNQKFSSSYFGLVVGVLF